MTLLGAALREPNENGFYCYNITIAVEYQVVPFLGAQHPGGSNRSAIRMFDALCGRTPEIASAPSMAERCRALLVVGHETACSIGGWLLQ